MATKTNCLSTIAFTHISEGSWAVILVIIKTSANFSSSHLYRQRFFNILPFERILSTGRTLEEVHNAWSVAVLVNRITISMENLSVNLIRKEREWRKKTEYNHCTCVEWALHCTKKSKFLNFSCKCYRLNIELSASNLAWRLIYV